MWVAVGELYGIGQMASRMGVSVGTLRRWDREGRLRPTLRTQGGHRRYGEPSPTGAGSEATVVYARVSCHDQKDDLERQRERLLAHARERGWTDVEVIEDVGSGLNFHKRGLLRLLARVLTGGIGRLVIEHRDRLSRFGAELIFAICALRGVEVVVTEQGMPASFESGLAHDVLEIITVFSARLYGARSARRKATAG